MKSLFLKIFLSFWIAQALFLVLAILVTIALRPARRGVEGEGPQILAETVNAYQNSGERGARDYLDQIWHSQHVRAFVFDPQGRELSGRQVPPWIEDSRQGRAPRYDDHASGSANSSHDAFLGGVHPHHRGWIDNLMPDRIMRTGSPAFGINS